jgi:phage terminase large subunit-like protein
MPRARIKKPTRAQYEAADKYVRFIESLKHSKGEWAGKPFKLMDWQRDEIIVPLFGTLNPDGTRQYRTCFIELPRKNGKTTLAAAIALALLYVDGEMGAEIYSAANDRGQAELVFNEAKAMVEQSSQLSRPDRTKIVDSQKRIVYYKTRSFYRAISAEAYNKWGINPHGIIYDELHAAPNRELWDALTTATGARRQPLIVVITTAGYDRNSICFKLHERACQIRDGITNDPTFLPVIYAAPEKANWQNEKVWQKANPALGIFRKLDEMRTMAQTAKESPAEEMNFRRLYLNQWTSSVTRWLPIDKWQACGGAINLDELKGRPCYVGLDLSSSIDLTALALAFPRDDGFYDILVDFWLPEDTAVEAEKRDRVPYREWAKLGLVHLTPGNVIDYGFIRHTLAENRGLYDLRELAYDRYGAAQLIQNLEEDGFIVDPEEIKKNKFSTAPVVVPFGQGFVSMSPPTKELMTLVLQKKIRHGNNPVLNWNADNMVVAQDPAGNLKPDKAKATQKIDGMVALIMALDRAIKHQGASSFYEGVLAL